MSALTHWNPFRSIEGQEDAFQDLVREFFGKTEGGNLLPPVEVAESEGDVTVKMAVPGVEKDQISISVDDHVLNVRGESKKETEEKKKNYYRQEIRYGSFARAVRLPAEVDASKTAAELKNGMLKITLPKSKTPKAHAIKINAAA
jgi:HSP20 family protein